MRRLQWSGAMPIPPPCIAASLDGEASETSETGITPTRTDRSWQIARRSCAERPSLVGRASPHCRRKFRHCFDERSAPDLFYSANKTSCSSFARRGKQSLVKPGDHIQVVEPTLVSRTADGLLTAVLFGGVFFVDAFFAGAFCVALATIFLLTVFADSAFFAAGFEATASFVATFLAGVFLPASFALPDSAELLLAPSTRNLVRSFAAASHEGAGPRPLHVAPVFGSRYFAGCGPLRCPLEAGAPAATDAFTVLRTGLTLAARTASVPLTIRNLVRSFASAIHARRPH